MIYTHYLPCFVYLCRKSIYMELTEKKERTVIHLQIGEAHEYFGSIANIYEFHSAEELGITYGSLRNYGLSADKPYANNRCIIKRQEAGAERVDYAASANSFRNLLMIILSSRFSLSVLAQK